MFLVIVVIGAKACHWVLGQWRSQAVVVQILEVPLEGSVPTGGLVKADGAAGLSPVCRDIPSLTLMGVEGCTEHGA